MAYPCWGIVGKNEHQQEAIKHLTNPEIDMVILQGVAGSGKSFISIAAGLEQVINKKQYNKLLFIRAPVSVGNDLGYLPGDLNEKLFSWSGALVDNLEALIDTSMSNKVQKEGTKMVVDTYIKVLSMSHIRGHSFYNNYVVIDEAQNISPQEMKVIITRAGENTKFVLLGDVSQIDNHRLSPDNNGLQVVIDAYNHTNPDYIKYIELPEGVRSRLCTWGTTAL